MRKINHKGFTLIELLIVIAIIGILASVILVSLNSARVKAKTAKSMAQLKAVNTAIETYYFLNGSYPVSSSWQGYCSSWGASLGANWIPELANTSLPIDPRNSGSCWDSGGQYIYFSNGSNYKLLSHSPESMLVPNNLIDPNRPTWAWGWWTPWCASNC